MDFVGIQETKKTIINNGFVEAVNKNISWNYIPTKGTAGGILVGFKISTMELVVLQTFDFCAVAMVRNQPDGLTWRLIVVYGSPYEEHKPAFLDELELVMPNWQGPTLVGVILTYLELREKTMK